MKKFNLILLLLFLYIAAFSQSNWSLNTNTVGFGSNGLFGTSNNRSIRFLTNGIERMVLDSNGILKISNLNAGVNSKFVFANPSGQLIASGTGFTGNVNDFLRADGTWAPIGGVANSFSLIGTNLSITSGIKLGIGNPNPITELDVQGSSRVSASSIVEDKLFLGPANDYAVMNYIPATPTYPAVFRLFGGGPSNPNNPNPGSPYNPTPGGQGGGEHSPDPLPDMTCYNGVLNSMALFQNMISIQKLSSPPTVMYSLGNINIGHDGQNAFIETQGTNQSSPHAGDLFINKNCNRNVYVFGNGSSFAPQTNNIMSVAGKLNVTQNMQIGAGSGTTNFLYANTQMYIYSPPTVPIGIKVRHGGAGESGIKLIELSDVDKGISINRGTPTSDGPERFSVQGDGKTNISTTNSDALIISDASNPSVHTFKVLKDGASRIQTNNLDAFVVSDVANPSQQVFKVHKDGATRITTSNSDALILSDVSNPTIFTFKVLKDGASRIQTNNLDAFVVSDIANPSQQTFKIHKDGAARITTSNSDAIVVADASNGNQLNLKILTSGLIEHTNIQNTSKAIRIINSSQNETFMVQGNGYTEIGVYSASGMPTPYGASYGRAFTIRDKSLNKDVFVVRSDGVAYAREVEISLTATFPDYVFDKNYKLASLEEIETYINANKHLPGFENEAYYQKNGINVNRIILKQQEKIEELTLHLIELEKKVKSIENH